MRYIVLLAVLCRAAYGIEIGWPWTSLRPSIDQSVKSRAYIRHVPGYMHSSTPSEHYGGYITVDRSRGRHLYYYLVKSQSERPHSDPLVLWLNGGPGCSSFDGFVKEHGPFKVVFKGGKEESGDERQTFNLVDNAYSWSKAAHMLYVDSPAGVGMSYSETVADYHTNDSATIADLHVFLQRWVAEYPEYKGSDFYVAGESYGGVYVPLLVHSIVEAEGKPHHPLGPVSLRLRGYTVGNPVADAASDANGVPRFLAAKSLISETMYRRAWRLCDGGRFFNSRDEDCLAAQAEMQELVRGINHYAILESCYQGGNPYTGGDGPGFAATRSSPHHAGVIAAPLEAHMLGHTPRCLDQREMWAFCNDHSVRSAIHARPISEIGAFDECTNGDRIRYRSQYNTMLEIHAKMVKKVRALVYSGDHDMVIPHTSTESWTAGLGLERVRDWAPWALDDGQVAGYAIHYNGLVYATVLGAGHAVPESKPREALALFDKFIRKGRLD